LTEQEVQAAHDRYPVSRPDSGHAPTSLRRRSAAIEAFAAATADRLVPLLDLLNLRRLGGRPPASHSIGPPTVNRAAPTVLTHFRQPGRRYSLRRTSHRGQEALYCSGRVRKVARRWRGATY
jgi:hypothetical protein